MFHVVTGGSGSGKSEYAEKTVCHMKTAQKAAHLYYIATMFPYGKETEQKIQRHRIKRSGKGFETIECFTGLKHMVQDDGRFSAQKTEEGICVLLECMSNLTANELYMENGAGEHTVSEITEGIDLLREKCSGLVVVTNEVFSDIMPVSEEMKMYLETLGKINCLMGKEADAVTEVVYGIEVNRKL